MSESTYPSDRQDKFMLRLPEGMRARIKASARVNGRSMNAEIVHAIGFYFAFDDLDPTRNAALEREMERGSIEEDRRAELIKTTLAKLERQLLASLDARPHSDDS